MTPETPDLIDTDLQELFAAVHPAAGFEDRLVQAVRRHRHAHWTIPPAIKRAAIAAAAVLMVGTTGYYGNRIISRGAPLAGALDDAKCASNLHQIGPAIPLNQNDAAQLYPNGAAWDFGGGSDAAQNWSNWNGSQDQHSYKYDNPFAGGTTLAEGWRLKDVDPHAAAASDFDGDARRSDAVDMRRVQQPAGGHGGGAALDHDHHITPAHNTNGQNPLYPAPTGNNDITRQVSGLNYYHGDIAKAAEKKLGLGRELGNLRDAKTPSVDSETVSLADQAKDQPSLNVVADAIAQVPSNEARARTRAAFEEQKAGQEALAAPSTSSTTQAAVDDRKIIRTGSMEFDVDRFDTAQMQIIKIVNELGGFVGATDSTKLPNGKVRGSISVRVPPERLDTLVLSLRALGDLKSQQITASDITKEYTDLQSELTADRAMQDRLLELIHTGKGSVKDLLAAENELGNWRGKIEKAEGMIRYYNGQVALSTLSITLSERDIQTPATAIETETADVGIESDDVEKARNSALKAIDDVKGRIIEAELKRLDAGQLAAKLVADVPPESAGAVIDQLKMLGKVARLEIQRQQNTADGTAPVTAVTPLRTERKPTRLLVSIYNLANVAPRQTTNVTLAANDVEAAYNALVSAAKSNGGRVVTSNLDRGDPARATGSLVLEFPPEKFEPAMSALRAQGDVLKLTLTENTDTQNSTEAKQGLTVQLIALAAVPCREIIQQTLAVTDVPAAYQAILSAISTGHARVQSAQLNEQDRQNITAELQLEIPRTAQADLDKALATAGATIARTSTQSALVEGTVDSKVQIHLSITSSDHLSPRETTRLQIEVLDVDKSTADAQASAVAGGGRVLQATVTKDHGKGLARLILDMPLDKAGETLQQLRNAGIVRGIDASKDPQAPTGPLAHAQIYVEFTAADAIVADQTGPWASIRQGLSTSINGLLWSLQWVVVGLCLIGPWAGLGWLGWKLWQRRRTSADAIDSHPV